MTRDFIEDLAQSLNIEGAPFVLLVQHPKNKKMVLCQANLDKWHTTGKRNLRDDVLDVVDELLFENSSET